MLSRSALQWLLLALLLPATLAFDVKGRIDLSTVPGNHSIPIGSKVTFGHSSKSALVRHDGSFELHNVGDGEHVLEAIVPGYIIIPYLITVKNPDGIHIQPYHPSRAPLSTSTLSLPHPMRLTPKALEEFYTDARGLNIFGMLKSPMVLMMLFSGIMMFAVPKLMANLEVDPEMAAEIAESRKRVQGLQNGDFMSSLSSMLAGTSDSTASAPAKPVASGGSGAGAGGARRRKGK